MYLALSKCHSSLSHFLFHYENGRYAAAYKRLIAEGGSLENFETMIGPADKIEYQWYRHLQGKIKEMKPKVDDDGVTTMVWNQ